MAYKQMAYLYDELMKEAPYDEWHLFTKEMFKKSEKQIEQVIDLGCGTGVITTKLASDGYDMIGVDISSDMLTYAEQKASTKQHSVQWIQQDLRKLQGFSNLDAAISYCDVINYITSKDELKKVFNRVSDSLKEGGLFIFDVHSLVHVQQNMVNETFAHVTDDLSYIWFCTAGENVGEMHHDLTFFTSDESKYNRFDEYHHQRTFSIEFYKQLLVEAGFENINMYADFSTDQKNMNENAERIFFYAEKGSRQ